MKFKAQVKFSAHGVGKFRSKHLYLYVPDQSPLVLPKIAIKEFFPAMPHGQEYGILDVVVTVESVEGRQ